MQSERRARRPPGCGCCRAASGTLLVPSGARPLARERLRRGSGAESSRERERSRASGLEINKTGKKSLWKSTKAEPIRHTSPPSRSSSSSSSSPPSGFPLPPAAPPLARPALRGGPRPLPCAEVRPLPPAAAVLPGSKAYPKPIQSLSKAYQKRIKSVSKVPHNSLFLVLTHSPHRVRQ